MAFPQNEAETIALYKLIQNRIGWRIVHLQTAFPDAVIENLNGARLTIEFEHVASNFERHGHNSNGCDLVVCWRNDWPDALLPVWALEDCAKEEARVVEELLNPVSRVVMDELHHYLRGMHRVRLGLMAEVTNLHDVNRLQAHINELQMEVYELKEANE
jgi:hypothetical protein